MPPWMLSAPPDELSEAAEQAFAAAWAAHDVSLLPEDVPRWLFLHWLAERGFLLHGSQKGGLTVLIGQPKRYHQPDEFSNTIGVYAASDGLWAMMYALRGSAVRQQSDMALRVRREGQWSEMRYFLSVAPRVPGVTDGRDLLAPGFVYVLDGTGFSPSPPYQHGGLGYVQEAHWVNPNPVAPLLCIPVTPADFPLPVRLHDAARVDALSVSDPWGFPWLE